MDTGSTNTFIDLKFALKTNCPLINTPKKKVTVVSGGSPNFRAFAPNTNFWICNEEFPMTSQYWNCKGMMWSLVVISSRNTALSL